MSYLCSPHYNWEREREREREREAYRDRSTHRHRQAGRHTHTQTDRQTYTDGRTHTHIQHCYIACMLSYLKNVNLYAIYTYVHVSCCDSIDFGRIKQKLLLTTPHVRGRNSKRDGTVCRHVFRYTTSVRLTVLNTCLNECTISQCDTGPLRAHI